MRPNSSADASENAIGALNAKYNKHLQRAFRREKSTESADTNMSAESGNTSMVDFAIPPKEFLEDLKNREQYSQKKSNELLAIARNIYDEELESFSSNKTFSVKKIFTSSTLSPFVNDLIDNSSTLFPVEVESLQADIDASIRAINSNAKELSELEEKHQWIEELTKQNMNLADLIDRLHEDEVLIYSENALQQEYQKIYGKLNESERNHALRQNGFLKTEVAYLEGKNQQFHTFKGALNSPVLEDGEKGIAEKSFKVFYLLCEFNKIIEDLDAQIQAEIDKIYELLASAESKVELSGDAKPKLRARVIESEPVIIEQKVAERKEPDLNPLLIVNKPILAALDASLNEHENRQNDSPYKAFAWLKQYIGRNKQYYYRDVIFYFITHFPAESGSLTTSFIKNLPGYNGSPQDVQKWFNENYQKDLLIAGRKTAKRNLLQEQKISQSKVLQLKRKIRSTFLYSSDCSVEDLKKAHRDRSKKTNLLELKLKELKLLKSIRIKLSGNDQDLTTEESVKLKSVIDKNELQARKNKYKSDKEAEEYHDKIVSFLTKIQKELNEGKAQISKYNENATDKKEVVNISIRKQKQLFRYGLFRGWRDTDGVSRLLDEFNKHNLAISKMNLEEAKRLQKKVGKIFCEKFETYEGAGYRNEDMQFWYIQRGMECMRVLNHNSEEASQPTTEPPSL
jgi:hypothetical protein